MKPVMLILLGTVGLFGQALPDPKLTPGAARTTDTSVVCTEYHAAPCPKAGVMELDHLVPLELGGADDVKNLWVQYAPDYHQKDKLENFLHREVCAGRVRLTDAQAEIARNWAASYRKTLGLLPGEKK